MPANAYLLTIAKISITKLISICKRIPITPNGIKITPLIGTIGTISPNGTIGKSLLAIGPNMHRIPIKPMIDTQLSIVPLTMPALVSMTMKNSMPFTNRCMVI